MGDVEEEAVECDLRWADAKEFLDSNIDAGEGLRGDAVDECRCQVEGHDYVSVGGKRIDGAVQH
jgi:hypothetical protein